MFGKKYLESLRYLSHVKAYIMVIAVVILVLNAPSFSQKGTYVPLGDVRPFLPWGYD